MIPFTKMHGAGNDFVVIDARKEAIVLSEAMIIQIMDRHYGVGCDQLVLLKPSSVATCFMGIYNPDGSESGACGNATRCIASVLMEEGAEGEVTIETKSGVLRGWRDGEGRVTIDMGPARRDWQQIPLAHACDTLHLPLELEELRDPVAVNMGNPHAVFVVSDVDTVDLHRLGPVLEHNSLFPERANIEIAQILTPDRIKLRVWERGAGETLACGTGACATAVACYLRGLTGRKVQILLPGGTLVIEYQENGHVYMAGPVATSFSGVWDKVS